MKKHFQYLLYVLKHKYFVFIECCKLGIPFLGIIHDWSKFRPSEWFPYVHHFYGKKPSLDDKAWLYHIHRNKHHWEYWLLREDSNKHNNYEKIIEIPLKYLKEMLADWHGAGRAIHGKKNTSKWYEKNKDKIILHKHSRNWIESYVGPLTMNSRD